MATISTNFKTSYGEKTTGSSLTANEWNGVMNNLDSNFNEIDRKFLNVGTTSGGSVDKNTLLSLLKLTNTLDEDFSADIADDTIEIEADVRNKNATNLSHPITYDKNGEFKYRGAAAAYMLGSANVNTGLASMLASVSIDTETGEITENALGDRVRFGSWYLARTGLTTFNCSHEFVELVNSGTKAFPLDNVVLGIVYDNGNGSEKSDGLSVKEIKLTGSINAKSSYLIRGSELASVNKDSTYIKLKNNYDIDLTTLTVKTTYDSTTSKNTTTTTTVATGYDRDLSTAVGLILYEDALADGSIIDSEGLGLILFVSADATSDFAAKVHPCLVDFVLFTASKFVLSGDASGNIFLQNKAYAPATNAIVKDQYALDPAKQAFASLTSCTKEASKYRTNAVTVETIPLNEYEVSFPHSKPTQPVTKYAPKASGLNKNILTDKTSPDFSKPNMVTCSFGINARTTRCFNWFSMDEDDEFVWIRKKGTGDWRVFESYKSTDGTNTPVEDSNTRMHRVEFDKKIISSVYKRMTGTFPGNSEYKYCAHKCIVYIQPEYDFDDPITYQYIVGKAVTLSDGTKIPNATSTSPVQTFTIYPKDWTPKVYHTTDQQGFGWLEYQVWSAAAEEINNRIKKECTEETKLFPILINTGDMTLNGTRVNEWLDYYNGGYSLFNHIEQMNVVGNNDLCNYIVEALGNGDDAGKSSPYYFHLFYCYEIPNTVTETVMSPMTWTGPLICNGVYVPSMYYFYFGSYGYVMLNSELTTTGCNKYWKLNDADNFRNMYTGYAYSELSASTAITTHKANSGCLGTTIESWLTALISLGCTASKIIVVCHEMPFTVTTNDNLATDCATTDRSISNGALVGCHMNVFGKEANWVYDNTYWFSRLLQSKGIKLCIGGHKHTYCVTYPCTDLDATSTNASYHFSKRAKVKRDNTDNKYVSHIDSSVDSGLWQYVDTLSDGVVYFMLLATGYKQTSNKELPSPNLGYSHIVPVTTYTTQSDNSIKSTADKSLQYPMYGTYEYCGNVIKGNIFRVINITKETVSNNVATPTALTKANQCTLPMYSERLCITKDATTLKSKNYWVIPKEDIANAPTNVITYSGSVPSLNVKQRAIIKDDGTVSTFDGNITPEYSDCTVEIEL